MRGALLVLLAFAQYLSGFVAHADSFHLIVCGSGGEPEFVERFADWGRRLKAALIDVARNDPSRVLLLADDEPIVDGSAEIDSAAIATSIDARSDLGSIQATVRELESAMKANDDCFIYLVGHGSHRRDEAKFMIPGPDLSAAELGAMLEGLPAANVVVINGTSSSAGFINVLGPLNIIVCTATKSVDERNATEFMEQFIRAIEEGIADTDHDGRSSVYEVCSRAASLTAAWYEGQGLIASEHALLEDNGDGLGTRLPVEANVEEVNADGDRAKTVYVKHEDIAANVPDELIQVYESSIRAIEDLKRTKAELPETVYYEKLEALLIQAAKASRAIRDVPTATEAPD